MFFDSRVFLGMSLLQSAAVVNGRKAQQELIRDGPTMTEGCGQDRCALWNVPTDTGVPHNILQSFPRCGGGKDRLLGATGDGDTADVINDPSCYRITTPLFNSLGWTTEIDKDALCQVCLSPPTGNYHYALKYMMESSVEPEIYEDFLRLGNQFKYAFDDSSCQGRNYPYRECEACIAQCLNDDEIDEMDGCWWGCEQNVCLEYDSTNLMRVDSRDYTWENPPTYKLVNKLFWSEDASVPNSGDDFYCVNRFQNYRDPCCLESLAPSVKPTLPTSIFGGSLAPTTGSDDNPCFSESATVEVQGKGKVTMKSLQVGDVVLTPSGYEKVYTIDHRSENKPTDFIQIHTGFEEPLEVTETHLIFKAGKMDPVEARSVKVGDELQGYFDGVMKSVVVEQISSISKNGLYNPITSSGTIVVGGLVTSTYTAVNISDGSNYLTIAGYKVLSMHDFMHMAMVPLKTICMSLSDSSICLLKDGNEHNSYDQVGIKMMEYAKSRNVFVQNAILFSLITLFVVVKVLSTPVVMISLIALKAMKKQSKIY